MSVPIRQPNFSPDVVRVIKNTVAQGLTDEEFSLFLHNCARTGLDPLARQIYAIKRGGKLTIQTGIDGFRCIAERTGCYAPGKNTEFEYDDNGRLVSATSYVKKLVAGTWHEVAATAFLSEYNTGQGLWGKMPRVMLSKVSESIALRRSFPNDLSGIYTKEEMDQADVELVPEEPMISEDKYIAIERFVGDHTELRDKLCQLCRVKDLREIKESQLDACRHYAAKWIESRREADDTGD